MDTFLKDSTSLKNEINNLNILTIDQSSNNPKTSYYYPYTYG
jgi:hypothetical protein